MIDKKPHYSFEVSSSKLVYEFESTSDTKTIRKVVIYEKLDDSDDYFHMGFGDLKSDGKIDYLVQSKNKDMNLILSTVVQTMFLFFKHYPHAKVIFTGSNQSRTRLYRSIISKFVSEAEQYFEIMGFNENGIQEKFKKNRDYQAFLIYQRYEEV
ncbi:MAG: hypothetical protein MUF45_05745 [Spirosomaceae bacterium]|jgi:hypothetical protein|nr:hypothetical protein [Spirosomataceae bacterium]